MDFLKCITIVVTITILSIICVNSSHAQWDQKDIIDRKSDTIGEVLNTDEKFTYFSKLLDLSGLVGLSRKSAGKWKYVAVIPHDEYLSEEDKEYINKIKSSKSKERARDVFNNHTMSAESRLIGRGLLSMNKNIIQLGEIIDVKMKVRGGVWTQTKNGYNANILKKIECQNGYLYVLHGGVMR